MVAQESKEKAHEKFAAVVAAFEKSNAKLAKIIGAAEHDVLAYMAFPEKHWKQLRSTNPLERLNKEIARRADVVGIFPTSKSVLRLIGALLMEQDDEWRIGKRYMTLESLKLLDAPKVAEAEEHTQGKLPEVA